MTLKLAKHHYAELLHFGTCRSAHIPEPQDITPMFRYVASQKLTSLQRTYARAVAKAMSLTPKNGETNDLAFATIVFAFSLCGGFKSHHSSLLLQSIFVLLSKQFTPLSTFSFLAKNAWGSNFCVTKMCFTPGPHINYFVRLTLFI